MADRIIPNPKFSGLQGTSSGHESDLGELAALFLEHGGGSFSAEVAADLALDIVLGEIVEQAQHATGATGAAILFEREGELVCRASRGAIAPEMGACLSRRTGLTGECVRTREVVRCDDALIDSRADTEASRALGVRSVVIVPMTRATGLAGVLEIFSSRAGAFDEQDEIMLEALAVRTLKNLDRAREVAEGITAPSPVNVTPASIEEPHEKVIPTQHVEEAAEPESFAPVVEPEKNFEDRADPEWVGETTSSEVVLPQPEAETVFGEIVEPSPPQGWNVVTIALVAAIVICAVLLATLVGLRMSGRRATAEKGRAPNAARVAQSQTNATTAQEDVPAAEPAKLAQKEPAKPATVNSARPRTSGSGEGGLSVYENGKEVFHMPAGGQTASAVDPAGIAAASQEPIHRVEPEYPEVARQQGIQGAVVLDVRIGRDGAVQDAKVVSGQGVLADAAIAAVKQWKFQPANVERQTRVRLNFKMAG